MVDQALLIYLNKALAHANNAAASDQPNSRLRQLLSWDETVPALTRVETEALIDAIDDLKVLDPACGSGAFPIGMLQKLVHILRKLDPNNRGWHRRQQAPIERIESPPIREEAFRELERAFAHDTMTMGVSST